MNDVVSSPRFEKSFTQQEPIPEAAIARAVEIMRSGRLHRYNTVDGEISEAAALEDAYAAYQGSRYCLACTSGGVAIQIALRAVGVEPGDKVLANAYTLAPVPGALYQVGAIPVFVEIDEAYHIDLNDLAEKALSSGAKALLLSHMRGHIGDMDRVVAVCAEHDITMIEDCAHTMGARWNGARSGNFGAVGCFSTQTYKHINSGEGGLLTTDDEDIAARAVIHSGSYMLYARHGARPDAEAFETVKYETANFSGRMDNLRAALIAAQLPRLDDQIAAWNARYKVLEDRLRTSNRIEIPRRSDQEDYVGSSIQFRLADCPVAAIPDFVEACGTRGVELKWFGAAEPHGFTSRYDSWRYFDGLPDLPNTLAVLSRTVDMRIPLTFDLDDCALIADIICAEASHLPNGA